MRRRLAIIGIATIVPLASMQPAMAAEPQQSEAFLGSLISRVLDRLASFFSFTPASEQQTILELTQAPTADDAFVAIDCSEAGLQFFENTGGIVDFETAQCFAPADAVAEIEQEAAQDRLPVITDHFGLEETISFKCPEVLPEGVPHTGWTENGYCWNPEIAEAEGITEVGLATVQAHVNATDDQYIGVPCDGDPVITEVDGREVYSGAGLCFAESEQLAAK